MSFFSKKNSINREIKIIDIHSHILPGLDDGARDLEESIEMLKIAEKSGVTDIICTPHLRKGQFEKNWDEIEKAYKSLDIYKTIYQININLYLGREVMFFEDMANSSFTNNLNGSQYTLVEFESNTSFIKLRKELFNLMRTGRRMVLAHVERYDCLIDEFENIEELIEAGILVQVNSSSIVNKENKEVYKYVHKLLKKQYVDFVASDSHDKTNRIPDFEQCTNYLYRKYNNEYVDKILYINAMNYLGVNDGN